MKCDAECSEGQVPYSSIHARHRMDASSKESLSSSHFTSWWSPKRKAEGLSKQSGTKEIKSLHNNWNKEHRGTTTSNLIKMVQKKNKWKFMEIPFLECQCVCSTSHDWFK